MNWWLFKRQQHCVILGMEMYLRGRRKIGRNIYVGNSKLILSILSGFWPIEILIIHLRYTRSVGFTQNTNYSLISMVKRQCLMDKTGNWLWLSPGSEDIQNYVCHFQGRCPKYLTGVRDTFCMWYWSYFPAERRNQEKLLRVKDRWRERHGKTGPNAKVEKRGYKLKGNTSVYSIGCFYIFG